MPDLWERRRAVGEDTREATTALVLPAGLEDRYRPVGDVSRTGAVHEATAEDPLSEARVRVVWLGADAEDSARARFAEDARAAAALDNVHVLAVREQGEADGVPYVVTDEPDGSPVEQLTGDGNALDARAAVRIVVRVLDGLGAAHEQGLAFGDLGPGDVIVSAAGQVKLVVFADGRARTAAGPGLEGRQRADLQSAGLLLATLLAIPPPPDAAEPDSSRPFQRIVWLALNERFPDARAMRSALLDSVSSGALAAPTMPLPVAEEPTEVLPQVPVPPPPTPAAPPLPPPTPPQRRRRGSVFALLALVVLAVLGFLGGLRLVEFFGGDDEPTVAVIAPSPEVSETPSPPASEPEPSPTPSPSPSSEPEPEESVVAVGGAQPFTDTGVVLRPGSTITVTAAGTVFHNEADSVGPGGVPGAPQWSVIPDAPHSALIGRIGPDGAPFLIGERATFEAGGGGPLFLGVNDTGLDNNRGAFSATVSVEQ
jgi:hypothetical protein